MPRTTRTAAAAPSPYAARPWLAHYPDGVPGDYDFPKVPLTRLLDDAASSFPTGTAIAFLGATLTYRELKDAVDRFASALADLGVRKGDRVALVLPNCPQNVIAFFATLRLGAVVVQHNPLYTETELRHQLVDCGATVVVCLDRVYDRVAAVRADTAVQHVVVTSLADHLPVRAKLGLRLPLRSARRSRAELSASLPKDAPVRRWKALLATGTPARQTPVDPTNDLALLQYTGGTTGASKGAMLSHDNLVSNAYMNRLWDTSATAGREVCLAVLPLFHAFGLTVCMNATVLLGGTLVLLPRFDVEQVYEAVERWRPTMLPGVPPLYKALTDGAKGRAASLQSIRICVSGAMRLPQDVGEAFEKLSGARLVEGYGMTETSPSTHCNPVTGERRPGSIGLPLPGTLCKVVSQDDPSVEVPVGSPGELAVRGPQVFRGYWGREDLEGLFTEDGYVLTGDVAVMDEDGWFTIVDRKKELIIAGGFNVYPSEVEEVLLRLPGVAEVVVLGVPDRYRGETVKAYVVPAPGATVTLEDVVEHCSVELAPYKVPRLVELRDELPRSAVGKVLRRVLLEQEQANAVVEERPASTPGGRARPVGGAVAPVKAVSVQKAAATSTAAKKGAPAKAAAPVKKSAVAKKAPVKKPAPTVKKAAANKGAPVKKVAPTEAVPAKQAAPRKRPPSAGRSEST